VAEDIINVTFPIIEDWQRFFPLEDFRPYQEKTISMILEGWRSGKRYAILEGPTGSGKSVIGITCGLIFGNAWAATPQKMLQDQYMRDFDEYLTELKGRSNYPCLRLNYDPWEKYSGKKKKKYGAGSPYLPNFGEDYISQEDWAELPEDRRYNCANAPCCTRSSAIGKHMRKECKDHGICAYIRQRDMAMAAGFTMMNFSNLLLFTMLMPKPYEKRPLLIVDECHLLENHLYEFATLSLSPKGLSPIAVHITEYGDLQRLTGKFESISELVSYIDESLLPAFERYRNSRSVTEAIEEEPAEPSGEYAGENEYERMKSLEIKLRKFVADSPTEHSHVIVQDRTYQGEREVCIGIKIKPFSVANLTNLAFGSSDSKVLLMSATVLDAKTYCRSLGIDPKDAFFIPVPSTFPPKNRPVICDLTVGSMSYTKIDHTLPKMMERIWELCDKHKEQKGIIHTGTYVLTRKLHDYFKRHEPSIFDRMLFQTSGNFVEKNKVIQLHSASPEPTIICGPGFIEGIDLKDDLARFNILMKLPFQSLADPLVNRKKDEFPEWYALQAALAIIQALGRPVRSDIDWAVTYILDYAIKWFYDQNKKTFPKHIRQAIVWLTEYGLKNEVVE